MDAVIATSGKTAEFGENCTPGYYNTEGRPPASSLQNGFYFGGPTEFVEILKKWRDNGALEGLELSRADEHSE